MIDIDKRHASYKRKNHLKSLSSVLTLWYTSDNLVVNPTNSITAVRFYALPPIHIPCKKENFAIVISITQYNYLIISEINNNIVPRKLW
ncbi:hypothetical protein, partial [Bacteroides uniformis]|uniref:hypothetical protein n=2 Tax=Bacteroides uniformis TaxID=820 RepID=UPI001BB1C956